VKWHQSVGKKNGHYQANRAFQLVRSLFRVGDEIGYTGENPCLKVRLFQEQSRERFLMPNELKLFYEAVMQEPPLWRDLLFVLLFTGQRKRNVCQMQWKDLDLERRLWYVAGETMKNGSPLAVRYMLPGVLRGVEVGSFWEHRSWQVRWQGYHSLLLDSLFLRYCFNAFAN